MNSVSEQKDTPLFSFDGKPSMGQAIPLGLQHVVAAIAGVVTPALLVAGACGLSAADQVALVQASLVFTALATIIQLFPIRRLGAGLPVVMGTSFAFVPTLLAIGIQFDLPAILGAQIIGGAIAVAFGLFVKQMRGFFPPVVTGTVIFSIGLSLYSTAVRYMAGGAAAQAAGDFGGIRHWAVAMITLLIVVFFTNFTKGISNMASILCGMIAGYIVSLCLGMVDFAAVGQASWFHLAPPMHFGVRFVPSACVSMAVMFAINAVQTIGDLTSATLGGMDREPTTKELSGGIMAQGLISMIGAFFGGLPTSSYSQNVGIITVNRVVSRTVFTITAGILLAAGFIPKFASILTTIPMAVIGGATISVFATITMTGVRMVASAGLTPRTGTVVGLSLALGVGVTSVQNSLAGFPAWVGTVFGSSSVVIAAISAIILNLTLPKE